MTLLATAVRGGDFRNYYKSSGPSRTDVTFVVQQGECLADVKINTIVKLVESSLRENNLTDNKYALVGYGGPGELFKPYISTSRRNFSNR